MARIYFGFNANLKSQDTASPSVDYIAFENTGAGLRISISCNGDSDYSISDNAYSARFKGLEAAVETLEGDVLHDYAEMTKQDFELLNDARPYELGVWLPDNCEDSIICSNLDVSVLFKEREYKFREESVDVVTYGN